MAVLVEAISVVVRRDSIDRLFSGGWDSFLETVPNQSFCTDDELTRVGFLGPDEVGAYIEELHAGGLQYFVDGKAQDICVVDQQRGPMVECDWLEFAHLPMGDGKVGATWLFEGPKIAAGIHMKGGSMNLATPADWTFKGSLSETFHFLPLDSTQH